MADTSLDDFFAKKDKTKKKGKSKVTPNELLEKRKIKKKKTPSEKKAEESEKSQQIDVDPTKLAAAVSEQLDSTFIKFCGFFVTLGAVSWSQSEP